MEKELRKFIWDIYQEYFKTGETCSKQQECELLLVYPSICNSDYEEEVFLRPVGIKFYSYELGPSRYHLFYQKGFEPDGFLDYSQFVCENLIEDFKKTITNWLNDAKG